MNLIMSGLDFRRTPIALRERLAFSKTEQLRILKLLQQQPGVAGCAILSTCNRTEIYISGQAETPWRLLCRCIQAPEEEWDADCFVTRTGTDAVRHLMEVACGIHSQIVGDDQVISQIRRAMELAQEAETADSHLSVLLRLAVTAGKRAKTEVHITRGLPSLGTRCRDVLAGELGELKNKKILVIGNGQMGRLAAELLIQAGACVTMTLRTYRRGETVVPAGCKTVPYDERITALEDMDAMVSATSSPGYVLTDNQLKSVSRCPAAIADLAVPRDVEPACGLRARLYDVDSLGTSGPGSPEEISALKAIAAEEESKFLQWRRRQETPERPLRFPVFLELSDKKVVLVGGGTIASRRIGVLKRFGCEIVVIAPELKAKEEGVTWLRRAYMPGDLEGAFLAVSATNDRSVNRMVGEEARRLGIPVSVADCEAECTFYFPAICAGGDLVAGVVSAGKEHRRTARAAKEIRRVLEELE